MRVVMSVALALGMLVSGEAVAASCSAPYIKNLERLEKSTPDEVFSGSAGRKYCAHMRKRGAYTEKFASFLEANPNCMPNENKAVAQEMRRNGGVFQQLYAKCESSGL